MSDTSAPPALCRPLKMRPHVEAKPWGGRRLEELFGKELPEGEKIGETWEISAIPGQASRVDGGPLDGLALDELVARWPEAALGPEPPAEFPLLVKFIDAAENLSVQTHPDDETARRLENYPLGKTECWTILDAPRDGEVIHGLVEGTTREALARVAASPDIERFLRRAPIHPGSVVPVTAGTVHAILAGTLLCEVQQSCDITYRLYDWDRQPPRELHTEASLESIDFDHAPPDVFDLPGPFRGEGAPAPFLDMERFSLSLVGPRAGADGNEGPARFAMPRGRFALLVCLQAPEVGIELIGEPREGWESGSAPAAEEALRLRAGDSVFLPATLTAVRMAALGGDADADAASARCLWVSPGG